MREPTKAPRIALHAGARVGGKYRLERRVAVGGMGEIWRARNLATDADVAVKVLRGGADPTTSARLRSEARLAATLSHRNIVRVFDLLEEEGGELALVMELLRGESLANHIRRLMTLPAKEAVAVAVAILSALAHAHEMGIVHRDVTPYNVFLSVDPDGYLTPKLVDFGIAKLPSAGSQTLPGSVLGTPRYMSPEQIRGTEELDGRSDLFAVAAVLHEMLTGASPFDAPTPSASLALVLESTVDPDPGIDPRLWVVLARAFAKRPYQRHAGAKEMASALCAAVGEDEASLAAMLRRDPASREELDAKDADAEGEPPSERVTSVEGQSLDAPSGRRVRLGWMAFPVAGACVALAAGAILYRPTTWPGASLAPPLVAAEGPTPLPSPVAERAAAPASVPATSAPAESAATAPAPAAPASAETPRRAPRSAAPPAPVRTAPRPAPVATTPGF